MKVINEEIKLTLNLMQDVEYIDVGAYRELQSHLYSLLEIKRNELQRRLVDCKVEYVVCDKPLSTEELKAGGWWCADTSEDALKAFISLGFRDDGCVPWDVSYYGCFLYEVGSNLLDRGSEHHTFNLKQIHRVGNDFYWSEK